NLPREVCLRRASSPPPCMARWTCARRSSARPAMRVWLALKRSLVGSIAEVRRGMQMTSDRLYGHRHGLTAADAERGDAALAATVTQRVHEGRENARTGCTDRMTERTSPTIHVDAGVIDVDVSHRSHRHRRECLVDLIQVGVVRLPAQLGQRLADGAYRSGG